MEGQPAVIALLPGEMVYSHPRANRIRTHVMDRTSKRKALVPWLAMAAIVAAASGQLRLQGRIWWCACGRPRIWDGDIWSAHNSQHLFDPYSFTHILHGLLLCGVILWTLPRIGRIGQLTIAIAAEALWEVFENTPFVIQRYREATIGLGYEGDSIANSMGDLLCCVMGFLLARRLRFRRSLVLFVAIELALLLWVRDNLTLNVLMLIHPVEAIKAWQMIH